MVKHLARVEQLPPRQPYELRLLKAPVLGGWALSAFIAFYESGAGSGIYSIIAPQSGVTQVLQDIRVPELPLFLPLLPIKEAGPEPGCAQLAWATAKESVAALTREGYLPHLSAVLAAASAPSAPTSAAAAAAAAQSASSAPAPAAAAALDAAAIHVAVPEPLQGFSRPKIADYAAAYRSGRTDPVEVAERIIQAVAVAVKQQCGWFVSWLPDDVRRQAQESQQYFAEGRPRSVLEGVPFAVKDVMDAAPHPTTCGTSFLAAARPCGEDAPYITALRLMGAILLGKTTLHEIGLGITGLNLRTGTARNPYAMSHFCGGSSSGSAAVLAAGLCPIAIGTDGGGSVRIPASFCGLVGLKPTNGRVSSKGMVEVDCTVATLGPLAGCVEDVTLLYAVMANHDQWVTPQNEPLPMPNIPQPLPHLGMPGPLLAGGKAGIYRDWFNHAEPEVLAACNAAVAVLMEQGVAVQDVAIPELEQLRVAHTVTIASEMRHNFKAYCEDAAKRSLFNPDVRLALSTARFWTAPDYLQCQRVRQRGTQHFRAAMQDVDVLLVPSTPCTAPPIPAGALTGCTSNLGQTSLVMRHAHQANMLGLPAISVPVGTDAKGLPIGFQIIGKPWQEATVLRWAAALEAVLASRMPAGKQVVGQPQLWVSPVSGAGSLALPNKA